MTSGHTGRRLAGAAIVFAVITLAALLGVWSRASTPLANFWIANAVLLGLFVRWPVLRTAEAWVAAVAAYLIADLATGNDAELTLALTIPNLAGPIVGTWLYRRLDDPDRRLRTPDSIMRLFGVVAVSSVASSLPGAVCGVRYFDMPWPEAFTMWAISELAMMLTVLPPILAVPTTPGWWRTPLRRASDHSVSPLLDRFGPSLAVVGSLALGLLIGGPGTLTFCLPALLWSALRAGVFETACLSSACVAANLLIMAFGNGAVDLSELDPVHRVAVQSGMAMLALGPLLVAVTTDQRDRRLRAVVRLAERDELTQVLNRRALFVRGEDALRTHRRLAVMMLDVDHFKSVNDQHGHAVGDAVLRTVAATLIDGVRASDLVGRLGGEEFALVLPGLQPASSLGLAESLRVSCAVAIESAQGFSVTVSIGAVDVVTDDTAIAPALSSPLAAADAALYEAKRGGRNQTVIALPLRITADADAPSGSAPVA